MYLTIWLGMLVSCAYVLPFYVIPSASRDVPSTICYRSMAVAISAVVAIVVVYVCTNDCTTSMPQRLGLKLDWRDIALPIILFCTLFGGPLLQICLQRKRGIPLPYMQAPIHIVVRNLAVAPLTEEVVFRACLCCLLAAGKQPLQTIIFCAPLFFGMCHLHHMLDMVHHRGFSWKAAACTQAFQFSYSYVFGVLATCIFMSTASLSSPLLLHVACNWIGFPNFHALWTDPARRILLTAYVIGIALALCLLVKIAQSQFMYTC